MLRLGGKYGIIYINNQEIDIEKCSVNELEEYLKSLALKQKRIENKQNEYISQILE